MAAIRAVGVRGDPCGAMPCNFTLCISFGIALYKNDVLHVNRIATYLAFTCVYGHDWEVAEALRLSDGRHYVHSQRLSVLWVTGV